MSAGLAMAGQATTVISSRHGTGRGSSAPVNPVDQRPVECWSVSGEPVDRVFDEIDGAWVVLGQVDEPFGDLPDQYLMPETGGSGGVRPPQ